VDIKRVRGWWTTVVLVFGMNAIAAYFFSEFVAKIIESVRVSGGVTVQEWLYRHLFAPIFNTANASLLFAIAYVAFCWAAMAVLYRKQWFLKI
jgi:predicted acyltransferase